jgi:hypothetical protein
MDNFAPGLHATIVELANTMRFVVFFVAIAGLMLHLQRARADFESMARPLVSAILIIGLVSTLPHWFGFTEEVFLTLANSINDNYTEHPMQAATLLRDSVTEAPNEFSLNRLGESVYRATLGAAVKLIVLIASLLQLPFLLLQYLLKLLCYLFLPIALGLMLVPSLASLGAKYVQQTLAVLSWPIGFAVTELVAYHLLTAYQQNLAVAYDLAPGQIDAASYGSLIGALLAALWLILGTLGTPFLMQALIVSGSPLTTGGTSGMQQLYAIQQIAWMIRSVKTGGAAAPLAATKALNSPGGPTNLPPPPPTANTPIPPKSDPMGDLRAQSAFSAHGLPSAQTTI